MPDEEENNRSWWAQNTTRQHMYPYLLRNFCYSTLLEGCELLLKTKWGRLGTSLGPPAVSLPRNAAV